ncbi:MAG: cobalamin-binding protein [Bacteroidota bacterium]
MNRDYYPQRIICLTEETTETLYLLGEEDRIVGISGFTVRPSHARKEKPKVSTFIDAKYDEILALKPDLVIGFSDIQADIAKELISRGINVWVNNHRSVMGILCMIQQLGALVGKSNEAQALIQKFENKIEAVRLGAKSWTKKPQIYFEEWYDPLISGILWVDEIIDIAGGVNIFHDKAQASLAKDRIIENPEEVVHKNPDIILASWCGKMFKKDKMFERPGWKTIQAFNDNQVFEIPSEIILQPGPAALLEGIDLLHEIFKAWRS